MTEYRLYVQEIESCEKCPATTVKRAGQWGDYQTRCKFLNRVVSKSAREKTIDPRCPLEKVKK